MKKTRIQVESIDKRDMYYRVKYRYVDMRVSNSPVYSSRTYDAIDELDAFVQFKRSMATVNYEVISDGL